VLKGDHIKKRETDRVSIMYFKPIDNKVSYFDGNHEWQEHLRDICIVVLIILKWILRECGTSISTAFSGIWQSPVAVLVNIISSRKAGDILNSWEAISFPRTLLHEIIVIYCCVCYSEWTGNETHRRWLKKLHFLDVKEKIDKMLTLKYRSV
jgi:hypothetical protein